MTPEKGKWYWVKFGYNVYRCKCISVTKLGGIFNPAGCGMQDTYAYHIVGEATKPWWRF